MCELNQFIFKSKTYLIQIPKNDLALKLVNLEKARKLHNSKPISLTLALSLSFYLIGCSDNSLKSGTQSLFSTKAKAEKAAKNFNCTGAHKMGEKWMPCKSHSAHEDARNNDAHYEHHHHH